MIEFKVTKVYANFNHSGDWFSLDPDIHESFESLEEALDYIKSKNFYDELLEILEDEEVEEYDNIFVSYAELIKNYGGSIKVKLDDEQFFGDIDVRYSRGKGYYIKKIEYEY